MPKPSQFEPHADGKRFHVRTCSGGLFRVCGMGLGHVCECTDARMAEMVADALEALACSVDPSVIPKLVAAVQALFDADHYDHFASRMSDSEMAAIDQMKALLAQLKGE